MNECMYASVYIAVIYNTAQKSSDNLHS